ncbi:MULTISPECIES: EF-hand domain-containing protein [unclassified Ruegeria]|uniref:EF-hand domain-containing protein n=1 Tax=unclassified Ruegeria TaxID=2625375 RepID=UPI001487F799|nr:MULTISPECIES: EF-hand domain-containing protein [unclassified Ruegeria]
MKYATAILVFLGLASAGAAETTAELNEAELKAIDTNNDGFLSKDEFDAFSDYAFQEMDDDKNGTLGQAEATKFLDIKQFQKVDRNNDSVISREEYNNQMNADFQAADQDGNGRLD